MPPHPERKRGRCRGFTAAPSGRCSRGVRTRRAPCAQRRARTSAAKQTSARRTRRRPSGSRRAHGVATEQLHAQVGARPARAGAGVGGRPTGPSRGPAARTWHDLQRRGVRHCERRGAPVGDRDLHLQRVGACVTAGPGELAPHLVGSDRIGGSGGDNDLHGPRACAVDGNIEGCRGRNSGWRPSSPT